MGARETRRRRRGLLALLPMGVLALAMTTTLLPPRVGAFLLPGPTRSRWGRGAVATAAASSTTTAEGGGGGRVYKTKFDPEKGAKLAAFSFSVYGTPSGSRYFRARDGSDIGFQDDEVVRRNFQYLLFAHVLRAKDLPAEANVVDRMFQGGDPDPYVIVETLSAHGSDVAVSRPGESSRNPEFYNARYFLYVEDLDKAEFKLTVKDKNAVGGDDLIGTHSANLGGVFKATAGSSDGGEPAATKFSGWLDLKSPTGKPRGSVEVALELVPLAPLEEEIGAQPDDQDEDAGAEEGKGGPQGRTDEIDWGQLAAKIKGGTVGGLNQYNLAVFLNNQDTDTQGAIWLNKKKKEMVLCFRGTEIGWKDLLTDALIIQLPLDGTKQDKRLVHAGFRRAFRSIREAVYTSLEFIAGDDLKSWGIDVCGHSLGGALATLMAHDLASTHPELTAAGRLQMYSYGSPRVGNTAFRLDYDSKLGDASFRIVNNQDVVARVPRATRSPSLIEYDHIGRTCLISFTEAGDLNVFIEGETPGTCPLRSIDRWGEKAEEATAAAAAAGGKSKGSFSLPETDLASILNMPLSQATYVNGTAASIGDMLKLASNFSNLGAMLSQPPVGSFGKLSLGEDLKQMASKLGDRLKGVADARQVKDMALSTLGLNATFVEAEMRMMESILKGDGLNDHYEIPYYKAMEKAFADLERKQRGLPSRQA